MFKPINNRKIRLGIVGCGRISQKHLEAINGFPDDFELVALCDTDQEVLISFGTNLGVRRTKICKKCWTTGIRCRCVVSPSGLHAEQAIAAARKGVNVISEKPMATRLEDGLKMVKVCDQNNVRLFVVKQNRKNATLQLLKRAIDEERFGDIKVVHVNVFWQRPQEYYDQGGGWRGTWEFDGGAFMNQASHYVDLLSWLVGPVEKVHSMLSTTRKIEAEDTGVVNIKWRTGALGSMAVTMLAYPQNMEGSITILGDTGSVKVGGVAVNEIVKWEFADKRNYDQLIADASYDTTSVYGYGHSSYYQQVINTLRGVERPEVDGREGLKSLELLSAIYQSAREGQAIGLPLLL